MVRKALSILLVCLTACAGPPTPVPAPVPVSTAPRIVSLNPCSDAILAEVADPAQLLAISHYSHDPRAASLPQDQARRWPATGGTVEEVLALDPDVVVAGTFLPPATASAFARLGIRVELVGIAATVEDSRAQVRSLAALTGHPQRGAALVARIDAALARTQAAGPPVPTLLWQQGGLVPGPYSLIHQLMAHAGLASLSAARGLGQGAYLPLEQVLADPPALLLTSGDERMLHHPALAALGIQHEAFDPALLYCGGPTIIHALDRLAALRRMVAEPAQVAGAV
jgi:iron complex transport system substrate-binding protein